MPPAFLLRTLFLVLGVCAAGLAAAQGAPRGGDPALTRCNVGNRDALTELSEALQTHESRNRMNALVMTRLQSISTSAAALRVRILREVRTTRECESLSQAIAAEYERLVKVVGPDPRVAECIAANTQALREALQAYEGVVEAAAGRPTPAKEALARLNEMRPAVAREAQSVAACRQLGAAIAQENGQVGAITATDPGSTGADLGDCRAANVDAYAEALITWRAAASARRLRPGVPEFDSAMARLRQLRDTLVRPGLTMRDCEALAQAIQQEGMRAEGEGGTGVGAAAPVRPASALPAAPAPGASASGKT